MENWYKIYYTDSISTQKTQPDSVLFFELNKNIKLNTKNYKDALYYNAKAVADSLESPLNVLLSGGVDSEIVIRVNHDLGIKQNVYTFRFENHLNIRDVESAIEICKNLNIPLKIIDFNISKFFENEAESFYYKTFCSRVETLPRLKWHEFFDGPLIFGDGEPYIKRKLAGDYSKPSEWEITMLEYEFHHLLYTKNLGKNIICPWYHFTPEMHGNFIQQEVVQELIMDKRLGKHSTLTSKYEINLSVFPNLKPKIKLVGYEGIDKPPGGLPSFMENFRDKVMPDVINSEIHFNLHTWQSHFK